MSVALYVMYLKNEALSAELKAQTDKVAQLDTLIRSQKELMDNFANNAKLAITNSATLEKNLRDERQRNAEVQKKYDNMHKRLEAATLAKPKLVEKLTNRALSNLMLSIELETDRSKDRSTTDTSVLPD